MKKSILVSLILGTLGFGAFAQNAQTAPKLKPQNERVGRRMYLTPEERAEIRTKRMKTSLNLSEEQYQKVLVINLEQEKKREELRAARIAEMQAAREKIKSEREAFIKKYESVLTPEQMTKLRENQEIQKEKMENRGRKWEGRKKR